jgi:adenylosuccinate lyase
MLALIEKGMSREEAYKIVQANSARAWDEDLDFREHLKSDERVSTHLSANALAELFDYSYYVRYVDEVFGRIGLD